MKSGARLPPFDFQQYPLRTPLDFDTGHGPVSSVRLVCAGPDRAGP